MKILSLVLGWCALWDSFGCQQQEANMSPDFDLQGPETNEGVGFLQKQAELAPQGAEIFILS